MKSTGSFIHFVLIGIFTDFVMSKSVDLHIVGGEEVDISERPYIAALLESGRMWCGSSFIAKDILVTAAHCVMDVKPEQVSVRAGSSVYTNGGQLLNVSKMVFHEKYSIWTMNYDIGLIWLTSPVNDSNAQVIELAPSNKTFNESCVATVSGWGLTSERGKDSVHLRSVDIPVASENLCKNNSDFDTQTMWCAGLAKGGKDACQKDSGGPAVIEGQLSGIVNFGSGCAEPDNPGVYASIPAYRDWIREHTGI